MFLNCLYFFMGALGFIVIMGFLYGMYMGLWAVSAALRVYRQAKEAYSRMRLRNFAGRN